MPGQQHNQLTPTLLSQGCMRVQVQPATCAFGTMTRVFMCHCSNTGVEQTLKKSHHRKLNPEKKFSCRSCQDSNVQPFDHESDALPASYPGSLVNMCSIITVENGGVINVQPQLKVAVY